MAVAYETPPIQFQAVDQNFSAGRWGVYLAPIGIGMSPKVAPTLKIEPVKIAVILLLQPVAEGLLAELALAGPAVFVGDVPKGQRRMGSITFRQFAVNERDFFAVDR